jgi:hypothetical protein
MCIYDIFKDDFGFYYFQKRELPNLEKIQAIVSMPTPNNLKQIQVFNGMA